MSRVALIAARSPDVPFEAREYEASRSGGGIGTGRTNECPPPSKSPSWHPVEMRMYLSSFRMGDHPEHLVDLVDDAGDALVIANAIDSAPAEIRAEGVDRELTALRSLGIAATELDLRDYFDHPDQLRDRVNRRALVWLRGGNVFMLRYALARTGADVLLADLLESDALVYAGYSAGPCVLAPSLQGLEAVDDPDLVRATYGADPIWEGLGLLDYAIVPHYESPGHPETEGCGLVAERYRATGVEHRTLRDGQAIVVDGLVTTIC